MTGGDTYHYTTEECTCSVLHVTTFIQREMLLERGEIRMAQNSANHQKHNEEIALGVALGPVSEKHR